MRAWTVAFAVILLGGPAHAQRPPETPRTYTETLTALSEVLGEAHYIRRLCYGRADQRWRVQMMKLMDLEGPPGTPQRTSMAEGFNAGYRTQEERFPSCSPEAKGYERTLNGRGARLAGALAARYRD